MVGAVALAYQGLVHPAAMVALLEVVPAVRSRQLTPSLRATVGEVRRSLRCLQLFTWNCKVEGVGAELRRLPWPVGTAAAVAVAVVGDQQVLEGMAVSELVVGAEMLEPTAVRVVGAAGCQVVSGAGPAPLVKSAVQVELVGEAVAELLVPEALAV